MIHMKQKYLLRFILVPVFLSLQIFTMAMTPAQLSDISVIPKPVSVISASGAFILTEKTAIILSGESAEMMQLGKYLAERLNPATGFGTEVKVSTGEHTEGNIFLSLAQKDAQLGDEGYQLTVSSDGLNLVANKPEGLLMASKP